MISLTSLCVSTELALLHRKNAVLLHIRKQEPDPLAQAQSTAVMSGAGTIGSAWDQEMLQATALPLLINCPKPL